MCEDEEGNETTPFLEYIDLDSMGDVELALGLEELYGISMEKERLERVLNAGDLFDYLAELLVADSDRRLAILARHALALNHNHLATEYGQNNVHDLWNIFRRLLAEAAAEERYELIGRETRLFP